MAVVFCLYAYGTTLPRRSSHNYHCSLNHFPTDGDSHLRSDDNSVTRSTRKGSTRIYLISSHSNPKILKHNRRSPYGYTLSPYDSDGADDYDEYDGSNEDDDSSDEGLLSDDEFGGFEDSNARRQRFTSRNTSSTRQDNDRHMRSLTMGQSLKVVEGPFDVSNGKVNNLEKRNGGAFYLTFKKARNVKSLGADGNEKVEGCSSKNRFHRLLEELDLDERWFPLLDYLSTFGLNESHFIQIYERHMPSLQTNVISAQERLEFLLSVGVKYGDIKKILLRQPQILEYTVESNLKSHVAFLGSLGIPDARIGQIITATPSLFSYSVENSLKPTVRYLLEEVGIGKNNLSKVVQLSPQILVQRIDSSWTSRLSFLTRELGAPRDSIVKMVTKHPQLLHYSIEYGLLPRINFLRSIGMCNSDILKVLTSLTQVFSLSLEGNLKPKYMYLINELQNEVQSLTKYPTYLSLSLDQRIRPRHRFLVALKKAPKGPFPLGSLVPTDECFCQQWAGTSLDKYLAFRQRLLLKDLAKKYEKQ